MKAALRGSLLITGLLLAMLAALGFLGLLSGVVPIAASSGHWDITRAVLELGKRRSVDTHTLTLDAPPLASPELVFRGAGHYESGCRPCHGAPGVDRPRVALAMLPPPPNLSERVGSWQPEELFYIVKHGIKLTGMPAWPSQQRDDEVWAMTAFLRELPEMDAREYQRLALGAAPEDASEELARLEPARGSSRFDASCARCHGPRGRGRMPSAVPKLEGQHGAYVVAALDAYAGGQRNSGIMGPIAASLTPEERRELAGALAIAGTAPPPTSVAADSVALEAGEELATLGAPDRGIPPCRECHGPRQEPRNAMYPSLAGQYAEYLVLQLELFRADRRGGSSYAHLMRHVALRLGPEQMRQVAMYYAALPGPRAAAP